MSEQDSEQWLERRPLVIELPNRGGSAWVRALKDLGMALLILLGGVVLLYGVLIIPHLWRDSIGHDGLKTVQNAKQIGYALFNFENDFGCYPNDETIKDLDEGAVLSSAGGSNYYFSQLIAGGYLDQEAPFYARTGITMYPDGEKSTPAQLLAKREVGFAYVLWDPKMNSGNLPSDAPLVLAYLKKGKKVVDMDAFRRRSHARLIVLRVDMQVDLELKPNKQGVVQLNGKDYFDWSQPHWGGQKPKIVYPE